MKTCSIFRVKFENILKTVLVFLYLFLNMYFLVKNYITKALKKQCPDA